jgi:hypothetical protein
VRHTTRSQFVARPSEQIACAQGLHDTQEKLGEKTERAQGSRPGATVSAAQSEQGEQRAPAARGHGKGNKRPSWGNHGWRDGTPATNRERGKQRRPDLGRGELHGRSEQSSRAGLHPCATSAIAQGPKF